MALLPFMFFKQRTAYELRISDWSSDVCSSDLADFRAWLAARAGTGLKRSSTARALSTLRGFFRWLKRRGLADNAALVTLRTPKVPKAVPKALSAAEDRKSTRLNSSH